MNPIIDRLESDWAVLEWDGKTFNFPRALLPKGAREGDVVRISCEIDREATDARRRRVKELEDQLFRD